MQTPISTAPDQKILVLDSGVGGLSICKHVVEKLPDLSLDYFSDNAVFPYGEKSPEFLTLRLKRIVKAFSSLQHYDAVVIACNTASTVALPQLREQFAIPFVGVVPAIKTAASRTQTGTIALLATPGTANRDYTLKLIDDFAGNHQVLRFGNAELVSLIEDHLLGADLSLDQLRETLSELLLHPLHGQIDTVVMGCTHFPLIVDKLSALVPHWEWLESGPAIASHLETVISQIPAKPNPPMNEIADNWFAADSSKTAAKMSFWASSNSIGPRYFDSEPFRAFTQSLGFEPVFTVLDPEKHRG